VECVKCVECVVFVHGNSGVGGLTTVVVYDGKNSMHLLPTIE